MMMNFFCGMVDPNIDIKELSDYYLNKTVGNFAKENKIIFLWFFLIPCTVKNPRYTIIQAGTNDAARSNSREILEKFLQL